MKIRIYLFFVLLSNVSAVNAQNFPSVDSLVNSWGDERLTDTLRFQIALDFYNSHDEKHDSIVLPIYTQFLEEVKQKQLKKWYSSARISEAVFRNRYYRTNPENDFKAALSEVKTFGDVLLLSSTYQAICSYYFHTGNMAVKLKYELAHLQLLEKDNKESELYIQSLHRVGNGYQLAQNYEDAKKYYEIALDQSLANHDLKSAAGTHFNLANLQQELENPEMQVFHLEAGLKLAKQAESEALTNMLMVLLSGLYANNGNGDTAFVYAKKGAAYFESVNWATWIVISNQSLSNLYKAKGDYRQAIVFAQKSLSVAEEKSSILNIKSSLKVLYPLYAALGNYKKAYEIRDRYVTISDSLDNTKQAAETATLLNQYVNDKKNFEDSLKTLQHQEKVALEHEVEMQEEENIKYSFGAGALFLLILAAVLFRSINRKKRDNAIIIQQKQEVELQRDEIEIQHKEIKDSIAYAKRIQSAILPQLSRLTDRFPESFILYKPKDVVAGDFYWMEDATSKFFIAAADCTGHGVPGAMVSVICNGGLNRAVKEYGLSDPGKILDKTREIVIQEFEKSEEDVKDGMDIALCCLEQDSANREGFKLTYSGANNPLWIIRKGSEEVEEIKADKQPIGKFSHNQPFTSHDIELTAGDTIYLFSDGFADQFGGEKGKKYKATNFKRFLISIRNENLNKQKELLDESFETWRGSLEQIDDVCVIGVRV